MENKEKAYIQFKRYVSKRYKKNKIGIILSLLLGIAVAVYQVCAGQLYIVAVPLFVVWAYVVLNMSTRIGNCKKIQAEIKATEDYNIVTIKEKADRKWKMCVVDNTSTHEYSPKYYIGKLVVGNKVLKVVTKTGNVILIDIQVLKEKGQ